MGHDRIGGRFELVNGAAEHLEFNLVLSTVARDQQDLSVLQVLQVLQVLIHL